MVPPVIAILGTGSFAPARIVTNHDLSRFVDTTDEWIVTRTGIRERRIASADEATSDLAAAAAREAMQAASLTAADIDLVVVATITPDQPMPATACHVQRKLGISPRAACFDLNAACTGFIYALETAWSLLLSGRYRHALVIGAEKMSSVLDWRDRNTCVLFGDGAGAVVLGPARGLGRILGTRLQADGHHHGLLGIRGHAALALPAVLKAIEPVSNASAQSFADVAPTLDATSGEPTTAAATALPRPDASAAVAYERPFIEMKGREIFKIAVREMQQAVAAILAEHQITPDQITHIIPHQANLRIIQSLAEHLALPLDRFVINLDRYGNTSAASIPLALAEAQRQGRLQPGDLCLLVAFGAGLTYGSALVRW